MSPLKVGLLGAGGITYAHVPAWLSLGATVSVHAEQGARDLAAAFGVTVVDSIDELLGGSDVVDICTPTHTHAELALRAIGAGVGVICEKPIARTVADARRVERAARAAGVPVFPGHVVRYFPEYVALKAAVADGRLGELAVLRFTRGGQAPSRPWFFDVAASGGIILDQMIHDLDVARWIAGEVVSVRAVQSPAPGPDGGAVVAHVTLTHRSGAISLVQGSWGPPGVRFVTSFDVAGTGGRLQYDSDRRAELVENLGSTRELANYLPPLDGASPYATELADFAAALRNGSEPRVTLADGLVAVGIAEAALASLGSGEPVPVDEAMLLNHEGASA